MDDLLADLQNEDVVEPLAESQEEMTKDSALDLRPLLDRQKVKDLIEKIEGTEMREIENYNGVIESHPEYGLILDANDLSTEVDDEISALFQYIRDLYSKRFPELESLISNPLDYVRSVRIIGNELNMRLVDEDLRKILPGATVMVITVTASTTKGLPLSESETRAVKEACENTIELSGFKERIMNYVQSRMTIIAPNLSALVGSKTAAQLMRSAGGLGVLSKTPSCNVGMIGMSKKHLAGLSSASADLHVGHIHHAEGMHDLLPAIRKRALRVLSAKVVLAARIDNSRLDPSGTKGLEFRQELERKLDDWQAPPPEKEVKPMNIVVDMPKKRRGGKRYRKMKEKYAMTELEKQQNRVVFGVAEEEVLVFDETEGLGMINQNTGLGKIRAAAADTRTKVKPKSTAAMKSKSLSSSTTSGLATSLAFTPVQGLELVDPEAQKKRLQEINSRWFSNH